MAVATTDHVPARAKTPTHLWVVGVLALLWNLMGAFDYVATQYGFEAYMSQFTPEQLAYFQGFPAWAVAGWAIAVWSGVAGAVGLLLRRRWAVAAFGLSLLGMVVSSLYTVVLSDGMTMMGGVGIVFTVVVWVVQIALFLYARRQAANAVLA